jgi:hypothetical protein
MKNKLVDLNNHLFAQLELLSDETITADNLAKEIQRTDAISKVATQIIDTANVAIDAAKLVAEAGGNYTNMLPMVEGRNVTDKELPALTAPAKRTK